MEEVEDPADRHDVDDRHDAEAAGLFDAFYRQHYASTIRVVLALRGREAVAEEVAQEAFLKALARWDLLSTYERPDLWVHRVALNIATSRLRRLRSEARAIVRARRALPQPEWLEVDGASELWALVRTLPLRQRQVVILHYASDLPIRDVAELLGCAEGTVKSHLHAARESLRRRYREIGG